MSSEWIVALLALLTLVAVVAVRSLSGNRIEIRLSDAVIAVIPVIVWLVVSGRVTKLVVGSEGITVETALLTASAEPIRGQVARLPTDTVRTATKGGTGAIPGLVADRVEGLVLELEAGPFYHPDALRRYLEALTEYGFFKYVIFRNPDGTLFGVMDARRLLALTRGSDPMLPLDELVALLNQTQSQDRRRLTEFPGMLTQEQAVQPSDDKRATLARMEQLDVAWLPVINDRGEFGGVVERSRLTASVILDVAAQLENR